eukprot:3650186-Rhodomonas_salina.1
MPLANSRMGPVGGKCKNCKSLFSLILTAAGPIDELASEQAAGGYPGPGPPRYAPVAARTLSEL